MQLLKSTAVVSVMTLVSRLSGFARDVVLARSFGVSAATDAFYVALRIPNLMRRLFAEGAFSLAFIPVLNDYKVNHSALELRQLIDAVAGALLAALLVVVALGVLVAPGLVLLFAPGFIDATDQFRLASDMLRITFPYALLISLVAFAGAILNSFGRFALPAFTPVLLNLGLIGGALFLAPYLAQPITALAWGVLVAGLAQLAIQIPALMRLRLLPRFRLRLSHPGVRRIGRLMLPTLFGSSAAQINLLIDTLIASLIATGSISWLFYSDRLLEFPLGVFGIALSTAILPALSKRYAAGQTREFSHLVDWGLRLGMLIALPAAIGLAVLAVPIVSTLFQYGQFSAHDVAMTAASVVAYALALPAYVGVKVMAPAYYARQDTATPVRVALIAMGSNVVLNLAFVGLLLWSMLLPAHVGLAAASCVSAYINAALLYRNLRKQQIVQPHYRSWRRYAWVVLVAVALMALVAWLAARWLGDWRVLSLPWRIIGLLVCTGLAALAYAAVLMAGGLHPRQLRRMPD